MAQASVGRCPSVGPTGPWRGCSITAPRRPAKLVNSTDLAVFAQDRFQPTSRFYVELGGRLDRDGVIDRFNMTPRVGAALLLNPAGTSVLRSGYGVFYERTPSVAGAYERLRSADRHAISPQTASLRLGRRRSFRASRRRISGRRAAHLGCGPGSPAEQRRGPCMPASSTGRARTSSSWSRRRRQSGRRCCFRAKGGRATARARSVPTTPADRAWTSTCRTCIHRLEPISTHSPIFLITSLPRSSAKTDTGRPGPTRRIDSWPAAARIRCATGCWWGCSTGGAVCRTLSSMNGSITWGRGTIIGFPPTHVSILASSIVSRFATYRPWIGVRADNALSTLPAVRRAGQHLVAGLRNLLQ